MLLEKYLTHPNSQFRNVIKHLLNQGVEIKKFVQGTSFPQDIMSYDLKHTLFASVTGSYSVFKEIDNLYALHVCIHHSNLKVLPNLPVCLELDCSFNKLQELPEMDFCEVLHCEYNELETIPNLPNLKYLSPHGNPLTKYPKNIKIAKSLEDTWKTAQAYSPIFNQKRGLANHSI